MPLDTRARILQATYDRVAAVGLSALSLEDVASVAGVSRQTLYRHFGSREGLVEALVLREEQWFVDQVVAAAGHHDTAEDVIAAGVAAALRAASAHPLLRSLLQREPDQILPLVALGRGPVISMAKPVLVDLIRGKVDLRRDEMETMADVCTRLLISYILDPGDEDPAAIGRRIARMVMHSVPTSPTA